jgi:hypothetical protein
MIASSRPWWGCPAHWCAVRGDHRLLGGPLGRRTGVVVLAPVPGRRCGLDNAGAGPSSGAATDPATATGVAMIALSAHKAAKNDRICTQPVITGDLLQDAARGA